jgi:poly-gamma-glutamate system protein
MRDVWDRRLAGHGGRMRLTWLSLVTTGVVAGAVALGPIASLDDPSPEVSRRAHAAQSIMERAGEVIRNARRAEGVESEGADARPTSSLIGAEWTMLTTTLGSLEAKRLSTSSGWASALVVRLHAAGLRKGDRVAAGFSGSFPGLNLAVAAACQVLDLKLLAVSSVTASTWGANQPGFTWPEIEARLVEAGVLWQASIAVSVGGASDRGFDLDADARAVAERIARASAGRLRVPVLAPADFDQAVAMRLDAYARASSGRPIQLYVNVGGTEASMGRSLAILRLRNGFLPSVPFDFSRERGVMARFGERGVPVLTLLNVRDLAARWGIL